MGYTSKTQEELADLLELSREMINKMVNGKIKISEKTLVKIANRFPDFNVNEISHIKSKKDLFSIDGFKKEEEIERALRQDALLNVITSSVARLMSSVYQRDLDECLNELEQNTLIRLREKIGRV